MYCEGPYSLLVFERGTDVKTLILFIRLEIRLIFASRQK